MINEKQKAFLGQLVTLNSLGFTIKHVDFNSGHVECLINVSPPHPLTDEERHFMRNARKIDAIKSVRARTHMTLSDAKAYVERHFDPDNP